MEQAEGRGEARGAGARAKRGSSTKQPPKLTRDKNMSVSYNRKSGVVSLHSTDSDEPTTITTRDVVKACALVEGSRVELETTTQAEGSCEGGRKGTIRMLFNTEAEAAAFVASMERPVVPAPTTEQRGSNEWVEDDGKRSDLLQDVQVCVCLVFV